MRSFSFVLCLAALLVAGCFGPKNLCSGACKTLCAQVPSGNGDGGAADVGLGVAKAVCEATCSTAASSQCDAWASGMFDEGLAWVEDKLPRASVGLAKARKKVKRAEPPKVVPKAVVKDGGK